MILSLLAGPIINWDLDPEIVKIFGTFPLRYYGLFFVSGIILGYTIVKKIYLREGIPVERLELLSTYIVIGTLLGARIGHCLFYEPAYYFQNPLEIILPIKKIGDSYSFIGFQGLASHGGALGVLTAIILYTRKMKTNLIWILDRVAIVVPLTGAFIRMGNFMNSEIYGKPTNGNWGVVFMLDDSIPRHPTQLYEAGSYLGIFALLMYLYYKKHEIKELKGFIFGLFLILLFTARFLIEFLKENQVTFEEEMTINMGQLLSVPFVILGIILIWRSLKMKNSKFKNTQSHSKPINDK